MDNRRGSGIFFGIVSIATLIVAIIGATFAYFSASISSEENAVGAGAYEFVNASMVIEQVYPSLSANADGLIPLNPDTEIPGAPAAYKTNLAYALNGVADKCLDSYGYQVCVVYKVTINNGGRQNIELSGKLKTKTNEASFRDSATQFKNLTFHAIDVKDDGSIELVGEHVPLLQDGDDFISVDSEIDISDVNVGPATTQIDEETGEEVLVPGTAETYVLLFLNENGDQSGEMGARYAGQLIYTSGAGNGSQLTGTFTVGSEAPTPGPGSGSESGE